MEKIRYSKFWNYIIINLINPLLNFLYNTINNVDYHNKFNGIINFQPKIYYDDKLNDICNLIYSKLDKNIFINDNKIKNDQSYIKSLENYITHSDKELLLDYFNNNIQFQKRLFNYFGFKPSIDQYFFYANLENIKNSDNIGSKAFHRDSDAYKVYEVFIAISDITDNNGPFYCLYDEDMRYDQIIYKREFKTNDWKYSWRYSESEISNKYHNCTLVKFTGKSGSSIEINTGITYHKGGYVENGHRVVARIVYSGDEYNINNHRNKYESFSFKKKLMIYFYNLIISKIAKSFI